MMRSPDNHRDEDEEGQEVQRMPLQNIADLDGNYIVHVGDEELQEFEPPDVTTSGNITELVIAMDLGTTYSGYCYAYVSEPDIHLNPTWGGEIGIASWKMPTSVCVDEEDELVSMGYTAKLDYNERHDILKLFECFKMQLWNNIESIDRNFEIESQTGMKMRAMDIFAMAIQFMKDHCINLITNAGRFPELENILWVLTVPAIWRDPQKLFMREAAKQAGLIKNITDENMVIALEPESASIWCRQETNSLEEGSNYMVIDAGGGTVDIICYKCLAKEESEEIYQPSGGGWGGNYVNKAFEKFLAKSVFNPSFINKCKQDEPTVYHELMEGFEQAKRQFRHDSTNPVSIKVGLGFGNYFEEYHEGRRLGQYITKLNSNDLKFVNSKIQISPIKMKSLLDSVINQIINHIQDLLEMPKLKNGNHIGTMFLVGGFGECNYLQYRIRDAFENQDRQVIIPDTPVLAVLKGAALYGCNPRLIRSRISPTTYSFAAYNKDNKYLTQVIEKGDSIKDGYVEERYAEPQAEHMDEVEMELYASDDTFTENADDPRNYQIGKVVVKVPKGYNDRVVKFTFTFGGTEIKIKGEHTPSGSEGTSTVSCLAPRA